MGLEAELRRWHLALQAEGARSKDLPARVRKQYRKAKDFTPEQLRLETYQRYNGGAYWEWDNGKRQWVKSPPNDYADESVRIEELVTSGRPPADW
ncbi:MAG: hypothetical protein HOP16_16900 [Acidobacteria bacterium]|nr:hypothetical protein [Acidobacteriota bacterium]